MGEYWSIYVKAEKKCTLIEPYTKYTKLKMLAIVHFGILDADQYLSHTSSLVTLSNINSACNSIIMNIYIYIVCHTHLHHLSTYIVS